MTPPPESNGRSRVPGDYYPVNNVGSGNPAFPSYPSGARAGLLIKVGNSNPTDRVRVADVPDGTSNTITLGETAGQTQMWQAGKLVSTTSISTSWADPEPAITFDGADFTGTMSNGPCALNCTNDAEIYAFHPGVATVGFGDGSVRSLRQTIPVATVAAMITRAAEDTFNPDY